MTIELNIPVTFDTFCIRDWVPEDAESLAEIEYDTEIKKYFDLPKLPKEDFISKFDPEMTRGWAIESIQTGKLAGTIDFSGCGDERKTFEIRIFLSHGYQGKGIGTSAVKYFVDCVLKASWVDSVIGVVHPENAGSRALMKKIGFFLKGKSSDGINDIFEIRKT